MKTLLAFLIVIPAFSLAQYTAPLTKPEKKKIRIKTVKPAPVVEETFISVDVEPHPMENIQSKVIYPAEAKAKKLEGRVVVSCLIDTNGSVIKTMIEHSDDPIFDQAASNALTNTRFIPAKQNGIPVKLWYTVPIDFRLTK
jgi:TonB family protein